MNYGLDLRKERSDQDGKEWQFGASSPKALFTIPLTERRSYLPVGEIQRGQEDMQDCATRGPINALEALFTYGIQNDLLDPDNEIWLRRNGYVFNGRVLFSDAFTAIKSGTTRRGNSLKAPIHAIHEYGLIPKALLPLLPSMTWDDYHNPERITPAMERLGAEFARRFTINYEQVGIEDLYKLSQDEMIVVAGHAWPVPVNGVYGASKKALNHAFLVVSPHYVAFDNYIDQVDGDFIKQLSKDYVFHSYGYRVLLAAENPEPGSPNRGLLSIIHRNLRRLARIFKKQFGSQELLTKVTLLRQLLDLLSRKQALYQAALNHLGRDASPRDLAPDELGCAETVSEIVKTVIPTFPVVTGTYTLWNVLKVHPRFRQVPNPVPGAIIISPTGTVRNPKVRNGHVGICGMGTAIMSNSSRNGKFEQNYTQETWKSYYREYPVYYYQLIK